MPKGRKSPPVEDSPQLDFSVFLALIPKLAGLCSLLKIRRLRNVKAQVASLLACEIGAMRHKEPQGDDGAESPASALLYVEV